MKLTKIALVLAVIAGIILYFVLPANQFFLYFGIPAILIVNGIRIFEQRKKTTFSLVMTMIVCYTTI
jgi:hypothetical protein